MLRLQRDFFGFLTTVSRLSMWRLTEPNPTFGYGNLEGQAEGQMYRSYLLLFSCMFALLDANFQQRQIDWLNTKMWEDAHMLHRKQKNVIFAIFSTDNLDAVKIALAKPDGCISGKLQVPYTIFDIMFWNLQMKWQQWTYLPMYLHRKVTTLYIYNSNSCKTDRLNGKILDWFQT